MIILILLVFLLMIIIGFVPFLAIAAGIFCLVWAIAYVLAIILIAYGTIYKKVTGKDARVRVPGSENRNHPLEIWMEKRGFISFGRIPGVR